METIRKISPFITITGIIAFFISINYQFHLFSLVPKIISNFMTLFGFGLICLSAISVIFTKYKMTFKLSLFVFLVVLYFVFHPVKYKTNDLPRYLLNNKESFDRIIRIVDSDSIFSIWRPLNTMSISSKNYIKDYKLKRRDNYNKLYKEIQKLNISAIKVDKNKYTFTYVLSQFGGFGLIRSKFSEIEQPKSFFGGEIKNFKKIDDHWYYFTYD